MSDDCIMCAAETRGAQYSAQGMAPARIAGMSTVVALELVRLAGLDTLHKSMCPAHGEAFQTARNAQLDATLPPAAERRPVPAVTTCMLCTKDYSESTQSDVCPHPSAV